MSDSQIKRQRKEDIEKSQAARPSIIAGLRAGEELLSIAGRIASEYHIEEKKAYKWVAIMEEEFSKRRKLVATIGLFVLWLGALAVVTGLIMFVLGFRPNGLFGFTVPVTLLLTGGVVMIPGAVFSLGARQLVFRVKR